ncbi:MAG: preprotein translocase subunit SecE [Candidatus Gracilibacteria bacterium]
MKANFLTNYVKSSIEELRRVTWPTKNQAIRLTIIVFVFCILMAIVIGALDFGLNELYNYLLKISA